MISRIDLRGRDPAGLNRTALAGVLPRAATDVEAAVAQVRPVCETSAPRRRSRPRVHRPIRRGGPGHHPGAARGPGCALAGLDPAVGPPSRRPRRTRRVHQAQRPAESRPGSAAGSPSPSATCPVAGPGCTCRRAGGLPSSVLMNVIPAQVAGVTEIAVASPPQARRRPAAPGVLAACALLGITEVHAAGGCAGDRDARLRHRRTAPGRGT